MPTTLSSISIEDRRFWVPSIGFFSPFINIFSISILYIANLVRVNCTDASSRTHRSSLLFSPLITWLFKRVPIPLFMCPKTRGMVIVQGVEQQCLVLENIIMDCGYHFTKLALFDSLKFLNKPDQWSDSLLKPLYTVCKFVILKDAQVHRAPFFNSFLLVWWVVVLWWQTISHYWGFCILLTFTTHVYNTCNISVNCLLNFVNISYSVSARHVLYLQFQVILWLIVTPLLESLSSIEQWRWGIAMARVEGEFLSLETASKMKFGPAGAIKLRVFCVGQKVYSLFFFSF